MYKKYIKRILDIIISFFVLVVISPMLILLALIVRCKLGSPVIFKQKRPGFNEKIFTMYKFRTMSNKKDKHGNKLSDKERLNKLGITLRATSLDELPQFLNILLGHMSIVGPRPLLIEYLPLYNENQHKRHNVRPGITGYAQTNGRNMISWEEKFDLDVFYVNNLSFVVDLKIIITTIRKVVKKEGVSSKNNITVKPFSEEKLK